MGRVQDGAAGFRCRTCLRIPKPVSQVGKVEIDQSVIGSCTNGRISDLRIAAEILKGKKSIPGCARSYPCTQQIYLDAMHEGLLGNFY